MRREEKATVTTILIGLNVIIFVILMILGKTEDTGFILEHGAMYEPYITELHEYYRLVTSMFLHFGISHLMNNMIMLGALGWYLEAEVGHVRFLFLYILSGIGGNLCSLLYNLSLGREIVSAGASGAIFGLMGALVCAAVQRRGYVGGLNRHRLIIMVVLSLYFGLTSTGVNNVAHIGGLAAGFLLQAGYSLLRKK